jgi:hypothetical protein
MDWKTFATLAVSIFLAFVGYIVKYRYDLKISQRKDKLDRVNLQLKELYGPLLALGHASQIAWKHFRHRYRPNTRAFWNVPNDPPTSEEAAAWRLWMTEVSMPMLVRMEELILGNADLIDDPEMPPSFIALCAHVAGYKLAMKKWESGDYSDNISTINYPHELHDYVEREFVRIKSEQEDLIALTSRRTGRRSAS